MLHTTGSRASAVLLMFPMPSTRLLERQRATAWGLQKSPLSELRRLVMVGCMEWEEVLVMFTVEVVMRQSVFASASGLSAKRWPGKPFLLAQHCLSKYLQISCQLDQKKASWHCWSMQRRCCFATTSSYTSRRIVPTKNHSSGHSCSLALCPLHPALNSLRCLVMSCILRTQQTAVATVSECRRRLWWFSRLATSASPAVTDDGMAATTDLESVLHIMERHLPTVCV